MRISCFELLLKPMGKLHGKETFSVVRNHSLPAKWVIYCNDAQINEQIDAAQPVELEPTTKQRHCIRVMSRSLFGV